MIIPLFLNASLTIVPLFIDFKSDPSWIPCALEEKE